MERFDAINIWTSWRRDVFAPRWQILSLLGAARLRIVVAIVTSNVVLGLAPVGFIIATSVMIGRVPAAVRDGLESQAFARVIASFLCATVLFLLQQILVPLQGVLNERMQRHVDGQLRDETLNSVMQSTGIGPMEDAETLSALSEVTRLFDSSSSTPGMACSGMLALLARYARLIALLAIVASVTSWAAAISLGCATMLFRHGQRGGLRKYSRVWRTVAGINRRSQYLRELAMGAAAAKEMRLFGLVAWLSERYSESFLAAHRPVAEERRRIYLKPYLGYTAVGLAIGAWVMVTMAHAAALGNISLMQLVLGMQAAALALLLGEHYPESDVPTQFGMQAVAALDGRAPDCSVDELMPHRWKPLDTS